MNNIFNIGQRNQIVGYVTIEPGTVKRELYEYAAWFRDHELQPGTYPVTLSFDESWHGYKPEFTPYRSNFRLYACVPTRIVAACLVSGFGGVNYGPDTAGQREIGKVSEYALCVGYGYKIDEVTAMPGFEPCTQTA